jgi:excisionase family DNA binding protein
MTAIALKVKTAAAETDLDEKTIRKAISAGELPAVRIGKVGVRILRDDLIEWMRTRPRVSSEEA